jgi:hypothetical protein
MTGSDRALDGSEILTGHRLRRPSTSPASIASGATGHGRDEDADREAAMRTERPAPWGFDVWDPRLTLRQQAADAQHESDAGVPDGADPTVPHEPAPAEPPELETVGARADK